MSGPANNLTNPIINNNTSGQTSFLPQPSMLTNFSGPTSTMPAAAPQQQQYNYRPSNTLFNVNQTALKPPPNVLSSLPTPESFNLKKNFNMQALRPPSSISPSKLPNFNPDNLNAIGGSLSQSSSNRSTPSFLQQPPPPVLPSPSSQQPNAFLKNQFNSNLLAQPVAQSTNMSPSLQAVIPNVAQVSINSNQTSHLFNQLPPKDPAQKPNANSMPDSAEHDQTKYNTMQTPNNNNIQPSPNPNVFQSFVQPATSFQSLSTASQQNGSHNNHDYQSNMANQKPFGHPFPTTNMHLQSMSNPFQKANATGETPLPTGLSQFDSTNRPPPLFATSQPNSQSQRPTQIQSQQSNGIYQPSANMMSNFGPPPTGATQSQQPIQMPPTTTPKPPQQAQTFSHGYSQAMNATYSAAPPPPLPSQALFGLTSQNVDNLSHQPSMPSSQFNSPSIYKPQQLQPPFANTNGQSMPGQQFQASNSFPPQPIDNNKQRYDTSSMLNQFNNMTVNNNNNSSRDPRQQQKQPLIVDLLREKRLMPTYDDETVVMRPQFPQEFYTNVNCESDIIRCTLTSIPESQSLLSKARLPLGILIHPFKDLESLKVVQSTTIVRCRNCRSYINPFVHFIDNNTKWRCNLCYSMNELPDEFLFDPITRSYGDPTKRPEITTSTIEFIAPAEYTLRPPPPAMYLFLFDVSRNAINTSYLQNACDMLIECLDKLPGDGRTQIGFITYNSCLHFYNLSESLSQPHMIIYPDIDEVVLPLPDSLMVNLNECKATIQTFLQELPGLFNDSYDTDSALGSALLAAFKLLNSTGGRVTVMQTCLPNVGVGALKHRGDSIDKDSNALGPQTDFYKKLALDCAGIHIAVDLFMFNALYADLATLYRHFILVVFVIKPMRILCIHLNAQYTHQLFLQACVSKYSGGEVKYYREFHLEHYPEQSERFCYDLKRYLTRKIGFEAVMRVRCTRGLAIHTFHGNFFVRSTDLLALPNVNPDSGFGMQVAIEDNLTDTATVCFQAALLYTSSKGERRIRIHTYCLPVTANINEIINGADQEAIVCLVAKMAVDRSVMNTIKEAKDALVNVAIDYLTAFSQTATSSSRSSALLSPHSLRCLPLYIISLMKNLAFSYTNIKMDDRVYAMNILKTMPLKYLMMFVYPSLYAVHNIDDKKTIMEGSTEVCIPPRLHLSSENIDRHGVYILDACESVYMWIGRSVNDQFLQQVFNVKSFNELPDHSNDLPELNTVMSERIRNFIIYLYDQRPFGASFMLMREDSPKRNLFFHHIHEDKTENSLSYNEFIKYLNEQVNKN